MVQHAIDIAYTLVPYWSPVAGALRQHARSAAGAPLLTRFDHPHPPATRREATRHARRTPPPVRTLPSDDAYYLCSWFTRPARAVAVSPRRIAAWWNARPLLSVVTWLRRHDVLPPEFDIVVGLMDPPMPTRNDAAAFGFLAMCWFAFRDPAFRIPDPPVPSDRPAEIARRWPSALLLPPDRNPAHHLPLWLLACAWRRLTGLPHAVIPSLIAVVVRWMADITPLPRPASIVPPRLPPLAGMFRRLHDAPVSSLPYHAYLARTAPSMPLHDDESAFVLPPVGEAMRAVLVPALQHALRDTPWAAFTPPPAPSSSSSSSAPSPSPLPPPPPRSDVLGCRVPRDHVAHAAAARAMLSLHSPDALPRRSFADRHTFWGLVYAHLFAPLADVMAAMPDTLPLHFPAAPRGVPPPADEAARVVRRLAPRLLHATHRDAA